MKSTLLTGIKPTGDLHLGNYIGAILPALQQIKKQDNPSYLFIADYHSLTHTQNPKELSKIISSAAAAWFACGIDLEKTIFYRQSDIPELFELYWILSCLTPKGLISRSHAYKAYIEQHKEDHKMQMGILNYPILMAADILLFQADKIPVGQDQLQHLETARSLASKFNHTFKTSLMKKPSALIYSKNLLPGIDGRKMSKSYNNSIPLFCSSEELKKRIMKIKTDSSSPSDPKNPENSIVFHIYSAFSSKEEKNHLEKKMKKGAGWGELKQDLFLLLDKKFTKEKKAYQNLIKNPEKVNDLLKKGAEKARLQAKKTLHQIRKTIGISSL